VNSPSGRRLIRLYKVLRERDGDGCFFCPKLMEKKDTTLEHLLSRTHGGSNHMHNLALAHQKCNQEASHMSVVEKVRLREKLRGKP
jgi:5-methylcytosine-specific restriction endonuclease McrA